VRTAPWEIGAQLLDLFDRRPGNHLVVAVHHRLHDNGVTGVDAQNRSLPVVKPAPLSGL
jgi:hypothetical protein